MAAVIAEFDAVAMTGGAELPRDLEVPGRELDGIHFAMDYLPQQNKRNAGDDEARAAPAGTITAAGKHVVVIGGGDTGSDCIGTAVRQGAAFDHPARNPAAAARAREQGAGLARLAVEAAHLLVAGGRLRARLGGVDQARRRRGRQGRGARMRARRMGQRRRRPLRHAGSRRQRVRRCRPIWSCWRWAFSARVRTGMVEQSGVALDRRGNVHANTLDYRTSVAQDFRRRRHAARPVARRVGDPRRPPMRPRRRRVPDGLEPAAAVTALGAAGWLGREVRSSRAGHAGGRRNGRGPNGRKPGDAPPIRRVKRVSSSWLLASSC